MDELCINGLDFLGMRTLASATVLLFGVLQRLPLVFDICVRNMCEKTLKSGHILNTMATACFVEDLNFRDWFTFRPDHSRTLQQNENVNPP